MTKLIYLDAGHGANDPGAVGNGLQEKDITLEVTKAVGARLVAHGFEVKYSRTTDINPGDASQRGALIGKSKADYGLSIHCNSSNNANATGAEIVVPIQETVGTIEKQMAEELKKIGNFRKIYSRCYDSGDTYERTFKANSNTFAQSYPNKKDYYGICRGAWGYGVSADIVELFFISNVSDCANYQKQKSAYVEAIVKAICVGFGMTYQEATATNSTPAPSTSTIKVGDQVKVKTSATHYATGQSIANFVKGSTFEVIKINGNKLLLSNITSWVWDYDIEKISETLRQPTTFKVKITCDSLNIRQNASFDSKVVGTVKKGDVFTITEEKNGLYKLKSGAGWISAGTAYVQKI